MSNTNPPSPVAVPLSHYNGGPLRQWWTIKTAQTGPMGRICNTPPSPEPSLRFLQFSEWLCASLKQALYIKTALELLFYPQIAYPPSHLETPDETDCIQHNHKHGIVCERTRTGERKEGRACISLLISAGAGKLEKLSVKLHREPGYTSEEPVQRNAVPDPFHPFDWAYFSTAR